jgi:dTDP-4-amino-4,6-dideoxygalactose transaminase
MTPERILLHKPTVGEREQKFVHAALRSGWVAPVGPDLDAFEAELAAVLGVDPESVLCLTSGTAAIHLGLLELGVRPGDDVVVQTSTFAATAFAVVHAGATPVFCDVDDETGNLSPEHLDRFLSNRARSGRLPAAVIPVDLFGYCADYEAIGEVTRRYDVPVLQDAAEALGSRSAGRAAATHAPLGVLSFNGNKIITTGGGGALVGDPVVLEHARKISTQAREQATWYEHVEIGFNYRMSNVLAALGRAQLEQLDGFIESRVCSHARYVSSLPEIEWFPSGCTDRWNHWLSVALLPDGVDAIAICQALQGVGIEARPYWKPMHLQPVFQANECVGGDRANRFFERGVCLPSGVALSDSDVDRVADVLRHELGLG